MKLKAVGSHGYTYEGKTVLPGDVFECDEHWAKAFIYQGRAVEVKEEEPAAPPPPTAQDEQHDDDEHDEGDKPAGKKHTKK